MRYLSAKYVFGAPAQFADGTAAAPSITFASDTNTGLYWVSADKLGFTVGGSAVGAWDATGLGIGTTAPVTHLQIAGNVSAASWTTAGIGLGVASATYTDTTTAAAGTVAHRYQNSIDGGILDATNAINVTNAYGLHVKQPTAAANVTLAQGFALFSEGNIRLSASSAIRVTDGAMYIDAISATANHDIYFRLGAGYSNTLTLKNTNLVGIGTTSPDELLHVEQATANTTTTVYPLRLTQISSGTPAGASGAGFGVGQEFELETATGGTNNVAGTQEYRWVVPTAGAATAYYLQQIDIAGTLTPFIHNYRDPIGGGAVPLGQNTVVGLNAGNLTMGSTATQTYHGSYNSFFGFNVGKLNTTGYYNTASGINALQANTAGANNSVNGVATLYSNTTGSNNTASGFSALYSNTTGGTNTAIGLNALYTNSTGASNIGLGGSAGKYETGTGALYIDAFDRTNTAGDKAGAIIYGQMNATPLSQLLTFNVATATFGPSAADNSANTSTIQSAPSTTDVAGAILALQANKGSGTTYAALKLQPSGGGVVANSFTAAPGYTTEGYWWTEFDDTNNTMKLMFYADGAARALASVAW